LQIQEKKVETVIDFLFLGSNITAVSDYSHEIIRRMLLGRKAMINLDNMFKSINCLALSLLHGPTLTSVHDYWKNHNFNYVDFCWQSDVSPFEYVV